MRAFRCAAVALVVASSVSAQTVDGWTLTVRTTIDSGSLDHKHFYTSAMRIAGHFVRTEMPDARVSPALPGGELPATIFNDSTHTSTIVFGRLRTASVSQRTPRREIAPSNDSTSRFLVAPTMTMHDLGAGEAILGHPTHKYNVTMSYVAQTSLLGAPCKRTVNSVENIWAATDMPREERLRMYVRDSRPRTNVELGPVSDSLERLRLHRERLVNGLILRSEIALTKPGAGGTKSTTKTTVEVLELTHGPIPQSLFVVPDRVATTPPLRRVNGTAIDSAAIKLRRAKMESTLTARARAAVCDP